MLVSLNLVGFTVILRLYQISLIAGRLDDNQYPQRAGKY